MRHCDKIMELRYLLDIRLRFLSNEPREKK